MRRATINPLIRRMVDQARQLRSSFMQRGGRELKQGAKSLADSLGRAVSIDEAADTIAQAAACAAPILAWGCRSPAASDALRADLAPWEQTSFQEAQLLSTEYAGRGTETGDCRHTYDRFLRRYAPSSRRRAGVFFTPAPIADYLVARVDHLLREVCGVDEGLANTAVTTIDPASGTGVFPLAALDRMSADGSIKRGFPKLVGIELLAPAAFLAKLNVALKLHDLGHEPRPNDDINILVGDALSPAMQSKIQNPKSRIPVLLGNPPFSSLSTNTNDWIAQLVRGDDTTRGYIQAGSQRLGERKTWLHDDYVKFIRLAQWHVEQAGCGIVGFVTNHGYLDNATFRLMRHELLRVFPHIEIVDLHGNRKKQEAAPDGTRDENVFGLDQGVAIGLFCRPPPTKETRDGGQGTDNVSCQICYSELWGAAADKLQQLSDARPGGPVPCRLSPVSWRPATPDWRFVPSPTVHRHTEYDSSWSLADAMPVHATAPVTARDHFIVGFTEEELMERIAEFRDLAIPDDEIRQRYFQRTRSARYTSGDTRGWKLADARRIVAGDDDWQRHIVRCLYRPFDWRYVFWHPAMVDWPRTELTQHLIQNPKSNIQNLCLIARRQQLPTQPCSFFWISDGLALDGVIRSDNRGSESLFPLYVDGQANFSRQFIEQTASATALDWLPTGRGDLSRRFGPEDSLAYIYALFHSPTYRERYADELRRDFPRVLPPDNARVFQSMCHWGRELIDLHLLRQPAARSAFPAPRLPATVNAFRAGGYFALKKWLQPKHRSTEDRQYWQIAAAISRTIDIMNEIDAAAGESFRQHSAGSITRRQPPAAARPSVRLSGSCTT